MEVRPIHAIECECARCGAIVDHAAAPAPARATIAGDRHYFGRALLALSYFAGRVLAAVLS